MNVEQEFNSLFVKDAGTINATLLNAPSTILDWIQENFTPKVSQVEKPVILQGELLPCPFCGGEASIGTTRIGCKRTAELNNRTNGFFVNCIICGSNNNFLHLGYATEEIAKEHWNKRAGREPQSK